jgi:hypothetical protein
MIPAAATITAVDWLTVLSTSALAGVVSILTSVATGLPETERQPDEPTVIYVNEFGEEISEDEAEGACKITVKAYEKYDDEGNPIADGESCAACDLTKYLDGKKDNGGEGT